MVVSLYCRRRAGTIAPLSTSMKMRPAAWAIERVWNSRASGSSVPSS
jgi:hypothetical protein